ncbi:MAG: hypothetical protein IJE17_04970 [Clostridia bacterium]|nr:hypothetical protein [Clostridia bacterium]
MQTMIKYMKNSIIETISETTDENLVSYIYTMLMSAISENPLESSQEDS